MLYFVLIIILAEAVYQTLSYRTSRKALLSHICFYLLCILFFLLISSSSIYITKLNDTNRPLSRFMFLDNHLWKGLLLFRCSMDTLVRIMIFCSQLIPVLSFLFILFFTERFPKAWHLFLLSLYYILSVIFFEPAVIKACYLFLYPKYISYENYFRLMDHLANIFRVSNWLLILVSFCILLHYVVFQLPHYRELLISSYCILVCHGIISVSFLYLFYWLPTRLIKVSRLVNSVTYLPVRVNYPPFLYNGSLLFQLLALGVLVVALFFQAKYMLAIRADIRTIHTSKDILQASSRIFAHYMKNEILAIQSEAELAQYNNSPAAKDVALSNIQTRCSQIWEHLEYIYSNANSPKLIMKKVNLNDVIRHELDKLSSQLDAAGIHVILNMGDSVDIQADISSFSNVIHNIISNAADALTEKNSPDKTIEIQVKSYRSWISIEIRDNGCGIGREELEHIFTPFYSSKPSKTNWGLGLTLCKKIIYAHNGRIQVESAKNKYTVVKVLLPYLKDKMQENPHEGEAPYEK